MGIIKRPSSSSSEFILFTKVQQNILRMLYLNTVSDFNTNEIIRESKSGTGAVQKELNRLTSQGIISVKKNRKSKTISSQSVITILSRIKKHHH